MPLVLPMVLLGPQQHQPIGGVIEFGFLQIWAKLKLCLAALAAGNRVSDILLIAVLCGTGVIALSRGWLSCRPEWRLTIMALPVVE